MKHKFMLVFFLAALLLFIGCDSNDTLTDERYEYTAFTESGEAIVIGTLRLNVADSGGITGTWTLRQLAERDNVGPQIGTGDLIGTLDQNGDVYINLNPHSADNNVFLTGRFENDRQRSLTGSWLYSTFVGGVNGGVFTAEQ